MSEEKSLLAEWDTNFTRSALMLWVFVAIKSQSRSVARIQEYLWSVGIHVSDQALYRSLRRWEKRKLVRHDFAPVRFGHSPRRYELTPEGKKLLHAIVSRYIRPFYNPDIAKLIKQKP